MRSAVASVMLVLLSATALADDMPKSCVTVKALGCYLKVPSEVLLVADHSDDGTMLSLGRGGGLFRIVPRSTSRWANLAEKSRTQRGHLEVIEYDQPGEREPLLVTVIHDGSQQLELTGEARAFAELAVSSCLDSTRGTMRVFRTLSSCSAKSTVGEKTPVAQQGVEPDVD